MNEPDDVSPPPPPPSYNKNNNNNTNNNNNNNIDGIINIDDNLDENTNCNNEIIDEKIRPMLWSYNNSGANSDMPFFKLNTSTTSLNNCTNDDQKQQQQQQQQPPLTLVSSANNVIDHIYESKLQSDNNNNNNPNNNDGAGGSSSSTFYQTHIVDQPPPIPPPPPLPLNENNEHSIFDLALNTTNSFNTSYEDVDYNISNLSITTNTSNNDNNSTNSSITRRINTNVKKPRRHAWGNLSYAEIITKAISGTPDQRLTLSQIYDWMIKNIPYFASKSCAGSSAGWKNSVRHNLSLHDRFVRIHTPPPNKCSYWTLASLVADSSTLPTRKSTTSIKNSSNKTRSKRARRSVHTTKEPYLSRNNHHMDSLLHNLIPSHQYQMNDTLGSNNNNNSTENHMIRPVSDSVVVFDTTNNNNTSKDMMIGCSPNFVHNNNTIQFSDNSSSVVNPQSNSETLNVTSSDYAYNDSVFYQPQGQPRQQWNNNHSTTKSLSNVIHNNPFLNTTHPQLSNTTNSSENHVNNHSYSHDNMGNIQPSNNYNNISSQQYYSSSMGDNHSNSMQLIEKTIQMNIPNMNNIEHFLKTQNDNTYNLMDFNQNPSSPFYNNNNTNNNSHHVATNVHEYPIYNDNNHACNYRIPSNYNNNNISYIPNEVLNRTNHPTAAVNANATTTHSTNNLNDINPNNEYFMNILNQCRYFGEDNPKVQQQLPFQRFIANISPSSAQQQQQQQQQPSTNNSAIDSNMLFQTKFIGRIDQTFPHNNNNNNNNNRRDLNDKKP